MDLPVEPRLHLHFSTDLREIPGISFEDSSSLVPVSTVVGVLSSVNNLMRATWDYAFHNPEDERFFGLRGLEVSNLVQRGDIELIIVGFEKASLDLILTWGVGLFASAAAGMAPNALWDLTKYSLISLYTVIKHPSYSARKGDKLASHLLPHFATMVRDAYSISPNGSRTKTKLTYREGDSELSVEIDQESQRAVLDADQLEAMLVSRITGHIVGVDYSENLIGIRADQFPDQTIWCDAAGINFEQLQDLFPQKPGIAPPTIGFDVEIAWRRGAANTFPPQGIRLLQIVPHKELLNINYRGLPGLASIGITSIEDDLTEEEAAFVRWFYWADGKWTDPSIPGVVAYLLRRNNIFGKQMMSSQVKKIIQKLLERGILFRAIGLKKRNSSAEVIRLNRSHPAVIKLGIC